MNEPLRHCPTCGTEVKDVALGLRDYRWLGDALPGRVAPTDLDMVLERNGRFLVVEFKEGGKNIPLGQRLTLKSLVRRAGADVWVVWGDGPVEVGAMDRRGDIPFVESGVSVPKLRNKVAKWFDDASEEE